MPTWKLRRRAAYTAKQYAESALLFAQAVALSEGTLRAMSCDTSAAAKSLASTKKAMRESPPLIPRAICFAEVLLTWKRRLGAEREAQNGISTPLVGFDLVFPSTATGRHFHSAPAQQDYIRPAGCCLVACPKCGAGLGVWCLQDGKTPNGRRLPLHDERWDAAGKYGSVGWHTFRHTYRSWLDSTSAPIGVKQKLMGHAQVSTTMNVYGNALMTAKREANSKVVKMALRSA